MTEQDQGAGEMDHAGEIVERILVARDQPAEILEPRK
jgi:hypothetical protein